MKSPTHPRRLALPPAARRLAIAIVLLAPAAPRLAAQVVAPPVVEYEQRAAGPAASFQVSNSGLRPIAVVLEPYAFWVDTLGEVHYAPFDSTRVKLSLSTMSVRLPPRATYSIQYEARAAQLPAWFVITATFAGPPRPGLNVRLQLPHVVYLTQPEALAERDVAIQGFQYDAAAKTVRFKIANASARLGRCTHGRVRAEGSGQVVPDFPLFPHFARWVTMPWTSARAPAQLELSCGDFTLHAAHATPVPHGGPRRAGG